MRKTGIISMALAAALVASVSLAQTTSTDDPNGTQSATQKERGRTPAPDRGASGASDAQQSSSMTSMSGSLAASDKKFVDEAARGGMAEVELAKLAEQKASSDEVKSVAKQMVEDHTKANDELKSLASQKGVTLPSETSARDKAEQARLEKLSGAEFDRAYVRALVRDHKRDVASFEKQSRSGSDPAIKDWASKTLPTLQSHLQHVETLQSSRPAGDDRSGSDSDKKSRTRQNEGGMR